MMKFDYDDINLIPRYSTVDSRSDCDTSIKFGKHSFKNPIIPANMESVINYELAIKLAKNGYFYIMHRFDVDNIKFVQEMNKLNLISSISVGVNEDSYKLIDKFAELNEFSNNLSPDYITIDIAHGHCRKMKRMIKYIKDKLPETFLIAGNVSTIEATVDLDKWGADAIKVGIGPGCFIPSAKVKILDGIKSLKDMVIGDMVYTHKNRLRKVTNIHRYDNKDILLKVNDLEPCTPTHEYYVINKSDKELVTEENINDYGFWIATSELDKEKHLLIKF